jgi:enoyl-[acyl-carrier protein] reductase II
LQQLYSEGASVEDLKAHLGRARAKRGMFEGDLDEGELEIGQVAGIIDQIKPAGVIVQDLMGEYQQALATLPPDFKS